MPRLLIVDDEPNLLYSLKKVLRSDSLEIITAETARAGIDKVRDLRPDVVILDVRLPDMSGLDAFSEISRIDARLPVIMITAYSTMETAIEATKRGAYEYLLKPVAFDQLRATVQRALAMRNEEHLPEKTAGNDAVVPAELIVGQSPAMQDIYKAIGRIAPQDVTVLIEGESGVGKELVAQVIYHHSRRSEGPFLAINCAAIPEPLLESELFGHERGAFTGAGDLRIGKFQQVDTGTLFLDEIGDMPLTAQAKVLRLLQDGSFERVCSNMTLRANVRFVAATNQNLEEVSSSKKDCFAAIYSIASKCSRSGYRTCYANTSSTICRCCWNTSFDCSISNWGAMSARCRRKRCRCSCSILGRAMCASCRAR